MIPFYWLTLFRSPVENAIALGPLDTKQSVHEHDLNDQQRLTLLRRAD